MRDFVTQLDHWLLGFSGSLLLTGLLAIVGWNWRWSPLCLGATIAVWFGYIFFWFEGLPLLGPVYYFETLPFLLVLLALGLARLYRMAAPFPRARTRCAILLLVLYGAASVHFSWNRARVVYQHQDLAAQYHRLLANAPARSLILVSGFAGMHYFSRGMAFNPRGLASDPLVVRAGLVQDGLVLAAYPGRKPFEMVLQNGRLRLEPLKKIAPVRYGFSAVNTLAKTGKNIMTSPDLTRRVARAPGDGPGLLAFGKYLLVPRGDYRLTIHMRLDRVSKGHPVLVDVATDHGRSILAKSRVSGSGQETVQLPFHAPALIRVEPRIHFGGSGEVVVADMEILQLTSEKGHGQEQQSYGAGAPANHVLPGP